MTDEELAQLEKAFLQEPTCQSPHAEGWAAFPCSGKVTHFFSTDCSGTHGMICQHTKNSIEVLKARGKLCSCGLPITDHWRTTAI